MMASASSPLSSLTPPPTEPRIRGPISMTGTVPEPKQYRSAKAIPFELAQHVQTYYEEGLFTQAYNFLISISANSISASDLTSPVLLPPTTHLSLASTIAVHPRFTTRTTDATKLEQASLALRLLRFVHDISGPVNAGFSSALEFRKYHHLNPAKTFFNTGKQSPTKTDGDDKQLNTPYADTESLYTLAEDFWVVFGWAFNCSVLASSSKTHAARWQYWSLWMVFMLDVLETDWHLRFATQTCEESLIWQYIELASRGSHSARRMLRAIFADGSTKSTNEFRMIFKNELKEPVDKDKERMKKDLKERDSVDIDNEIYGDYLLENDSEDSEEIDSQLSTKKPRTRAPSSRRITPRGSGQSLRSDYNASDPNSPPLASTAINNLGDSTSIALRLRLLNLLTNVAGHPDLTSTSPTTFPDLGELYILFVEHIKPLPLAAFQSMILSPASFTHLSPDIHTTLAEFLLQRLLESDAQFDNADKFLTQGKLESNYLPFAAAAGSGSGRLAQDSGDRRAYNGGGSGVITVIEANAKVSLLLEALMRRLLREGDVLHGTDALLNAVADGVERRLERAGEGLCRPETKRRAQNGGSTKKKTRTSLKKDGRGRLSSALAQKNEDAQDKNEDENGDDEYEDTIVVQVNGQPAASEDDDIDDDDDDDEVDELALSSDERRRKRSRLAKHGGLLETEAWNWLFESGERMLLIARTL